MAICKFFKIFTSFKDKIKILSFNAVIGLKAMSTDAKSNLKVPTAGIIIIGDEIIKGQVQDTNSKFLCNKLYRLGVRVERISVIRDDIDVIASEVQIFSQKYQYVLTSGGIGPTHDDVTYEGIAKALKEPVHVHPELEELVKKFFKINNPDDPALKLATIPKSSKLHYKSDQIKGSRILFPIVLVKNIYVFPGVPHLLEKLFDHVGKDLFSHPEFQPHYAEIYINKREVEITPVINEAVVLFIDDVIFGSYPILNHSYYKVKITMESKREEKNVEAEHFFREKLKNGVLINYDVDPLTNITTKFDNFLATCKNNKLVENVRQSVSVLEECFKKYKLPEVCISFNGGKDCTVLLHLVHVVAQKNNLLQDQKLRVLYIRDKSPFPQVEQFVHQSSVRYDFNLDTITGSVKDALKQMKSSYPEVTVAIMGVRRSDPHSINSLPFQETDADWPRYIRVSPILDWQYDDIWEFIRTLYLPYCELYDKGYTSIGHMDDTLPNSKLQYTDEHGFVQYRPAYELKEVEEERRGRLS